MDNLHNCSNNGTYLTSDSGVVITNMVLSSVSMSLSAAGCILIIFTYVAYKTLRTRARAMLFHLSVADLIIVLSHIIGLWNYKKFINNVEDVNSSNRDALCVSQAAFTMFGTLSSLLWSNAIGFFVLLLVILNSSKSETINRLFYATSCVVCWGIPALIVTVNAAKRYLGFHPIGTADCYIINVVGSSNIPNLDYELTEFFSYDVWVFISFLVLPVLYSFVLYYTRFRSKNKDDIIFRPRKPSLEMKLLLVPVVLFMLRIWSVILAIMGYFKHEDDNYKFGCFKITVVLLLLNSIGVNGQGFANAILFCILTQPVRRRLVKSLRKVCCVCFRHDGQYNEDLLLSTSLNEEELQESSSSSQYNSIN